MIDSQLNNSNAQSSICQGFAEKKRVERRLEMLYVKVQGHTKLPGSIAEFILAIINAIHCHNCDPLSTSEWRTSAEIYKQSI